MIKSSKNILVTFVVVIGMLLSFTIYYSGVDISFSTEITAENNSSSENLISTADASADDQIHICYDIPNFDSNLIESKILSSFFVLSQPSFSIWQPPKIS
ncbi:MAG: hypothetical protein RQ864_09990 [Lutibacter sp.]|nr:hypothetical protein [Lutibacter sp.]MDT8418129.1 hypothetical protein [Lutibacter sp.]